MCTLVQPKPPLWSFYLPPSRPSPLCTRRRAENSGRAGAFPRKNGSFVPGATRPYSDRQSGNL